MRDALAAVLMFAGVAVQALCCVGVARMRTALAALHYASPGGVAAALIAAGLLVREGLSQASGRGLMVAGLLFVAGPVLAHVSARAVARRSEDR
jgi:multisubunit Na+/H+ antiporter MnhG subunit